MHTYTDVESDVILEKLNEVRKSVLPYAKEVMETNREDVLDAMDMALYMADKAFREGILSLVYEGERLAACNCATKKLLALGLNENSLIGHTSLAEMLEEYDTRLHNHVEDYISYIYMRTMLAIHVGLKPQLVRSLLRSILPPEERINLNSRRTDVR